MCTCILALLLIMMRAMHCGFTPSDAASGGFGRGGGSNRMGDLPDTTIKVTTTTTTTSGNHNSTLSNLLEDPNRRFLETNHLEECQRFYNSYASLILLIISVVFMIFTCCMLFEQIETISTNSSKIARMKMRVGQAGTELARVTEEFNEMFGGTSNQVAVHWFLPTEVEFPRGMKKVVLGYEWDETFDPVPYEEHAGIHGVAAATAASNGGLNAGSVGAGPDEEQGVGVELTSTSMSATAALKQAPLNTSDEEAEEASFSGTPVSESRPHLIKRSNSRGPDPRLKPAPGTLT